MIVSFKCKHTKELWLNGEAKKFPPEIQKTALRKLWQLDNAELLKEICRLHQIIDLNHSKTIDWGNIASESIINGESVLYGKTDRSKK